MRKRDKNARKTPKNAPKSTFRATVQNLLKITKKCNLPKSTRRKLTKRPFFCLFLMLYNLSGIIIEERRKINPNGYKISRMWLRVKYMRNLNPVEFFAWQIMISVLYLICNLINLNALYGKPTNKSSGMLLWGLPFEVYSDRAPYG